MAAPGKHSKWGSLLSQAVAGVESRLDTILAEEAANPPSQGANTPDPPPPAAPPKPSPDSVPGISSPSPSGNRVNDRLQARLAKALAGKNAPGAAASSVTTSPRRSADRASRGSLERLSTDTGDRFEQSDTPSADTAVADACRAAGPEAHPDTVDARQPDRESSLEHVVFGDAASREHTAPEPEESQPPETGPMAHQADQSSLAEEMDRLKKQQQQEIQEYVERIDSLQSKLQYLSKSAVDSAKQAATSAPSGSVERKLAEKDEKIALLMDEGQKLSGTEQKLRTAIKKLRSQMTEHEKQMDELRKGRDKAASEAESLRNRLNGAEGSEKREQETRRATAALQRELDALKRENANKDEACRRLEQEVRTKAEQAQAASAEALSKALAVERGKQKELEDANAALRVEKESLTEKMRQETVEWREKLDRAAERSRIVEEELRMELRSMEGKLEAMRTAAEEASSGSGGEAQVKMFRQIETLQSQYASARENWQGIESSLLAKAANLERERDEAQRRESEMRKKTRDTASRCRHLEDDLQDAQTALAAARRELEACRDQLVALQASSKTTEEALDQARADLDKEKQHSAHRDDLVEAERRRWVDDVAGATSSKGLQSRPDVLPLSSASRTLSPDFALPIPGNLRRVVTPVGSVPDSPVELISPIRRLSSQPQVLPTRPYGVASTAGSGPPPSLFLPLDPPNEPPQASSPPVAERENGVDDTAPSSPRNLAQDMISVSTVAAGPSVQLVERMSAAVRRLEAEKVAAKEEMARVCNQRDEARADMASLMKELEDSRAASKRVPQLEDEVSRLDSRYQTTLEMLGEKSELVEELRADVEDVKAMYRELVERTVT